MTLLDAQNELIQWFLENDYVDLDKDLLNIFVLTENLNLDRLIIKSIAFEALKKLESIEIVSQLGSSNQFVLNKKVSQFNQSIDIDGETCSIISTIINKYCDILDQEKERCDPTSLSSRDLRNILNIIFLLEEKLNNSNLSLDE